MKLSQFVACSCLVLVGALLFEAAEARRYNSAPVRYTDYAAMDSDAGYSTNCIGYHCNYNSNSAASSYSSRQRSPYGPYHSYAVRPALYGGHGLYHYTGYARHYPAPPARHQPHYRHVRSYKPAGYGLKPVKALMLAPAYHASRPSSSSYGSSGSGSSSSTRYNQRGHNYRQKRGYNAGSYSSGMPMPSNYRSPYGPAPAHMSSSNYNKNYQAPTSSRYNTRGSSMTYKPPTAGY